VDGPCGLATLALRFLGFLKDEEESSSRFADSRFAMQTLEPPTCANGEVCRPHEGRGRGMLTSWKNTWQTTFESAADLSHPRQGRPEIGRRRPGARVPWTTAKTSPRGVRDWMFFEDLLRGDRWRSVFSENLGLHKVLVPEVRVVMALHRPCEVGADASPRVRRASGRTGDVLWNGRLLRGVSTTATTIRDRRIVRSPHGAGLHSGTITLHIHTAAKAVDGSGSRV